MKKDRQNLFSRILHFLGCKYLLPELPYGLQDNVFKRFYISAKQAMILAGHKDSFSDLLLLDVEPLSLGLETADGIMAMMIPRNSTIPCKRTTTFTTYHDNQVTMMFRVFEGERCFTKENSDLGMFEMTGIRAERRGRARIDVTFDIDANGVLTITAVNKASKKSQSCTLTNFKGKIYCLCLSMVLIRHNNACKVIATKPSSIIHFLRMLMT